MAIGKNKRLTKGKKGLKKKLVCPYTRKDWYDIKAPTLFTVRNIGKTLVNRTQGLKTAEDGLKGRVLEMSLGDLNTKSEDQAFRKFKLRIDEIQGRNCLTSFHSMTYSTDKMKGMVKKWQSLIEAHVDVKTTDGYIIRAFCVGFTKRRPKQVKKTCYAQTSQIKAIRKRMHEIMIREINGCDLKEVIAKLIPDSIGKEIEQVAQAIFPLQNVCVHKVKILKAPKYDLQKLLELHNESADLSAEGTVASADTWSEPIPSESV